MKRIQKDMPIFFSSQLFDYLKIDYCKRATAQSRIEYLRLKKQDIQALTMAKISQEGYEDVIQYALFDLKYGSLLCVFNGDGECCRAYLFRDIDIN